MAGEIQLNSVTLATESGGTISLSGDVDTLTPTKTALNASGSAPIYACRAWVNFNGTFNDAAGNSGTYACSNRTITCSVTSHGLSVGDSIHAAFTRSSGDTTTITDDWFVILTVPDSNTFTIQTIASTTDQAGTINYDFGDGPIRASGNVSSITDLGSGYYEVNLTTAMSDADFSISTSIGNTSMTNTSDYARCVAAIPISSSSVKVVTFTSSTTAVNDNSVVGISVFR